MVLVYKSSVSSFIDAFATIVQTLADQLVCCVILIREATGSLGDQGDVAVGVVFIAVCGITAVWVGGNKRGIRAVCAGNIGERVESRVQSLDSKPIIKLIDGFRPQGPGYAFAPEQSAALLQIL